MDSRENILLEYVWNISIKKEYQLPNNLRLEYATLPKDYNPAGGDGMVLYRVDNQQVMIFIRQGCEDKLMLPLTLFHEYSEGQAMKNGIEFDRFNRLLIQYQDFILGCYPDHTQILGELFDLISGGEYSAILVGVYRSVFVDDLPHVDAVLQEIDFCHTYFSDLIPVLKKSIIDHNRLCL